MNKLFGGKMERTFIAEIIPEQKCKISGYVERFRESKNMIFIVLPRKETPKTLKDIRACCDNKVFVVASEVSKYAGGYGMIK